MFTVMFWISKQEMRVIDLDPAKQWRPGEQGSYCDVINAPLFETADEGWQWIRDHYPQYQP